MKPLLAVDIDGVCAEYCPYVLSLHPEHLEDYKKGNMTDALEKLLNDMAVAETFAALNPVMDAPQYLRDISEFYDIHYVTARNTACRDVTVDWLGKHHFPSADNISFTEDKGLTCFSLQAYILIEDQLKYAIPATGYGIKVVLLDAPYNKPGSNRYDPRIINNSMIERATCWTDVLFKVYFKR
jgi:uncharacterized HAD superfamily protein